MSLFNVKSEPAECKREEYTEQLTSEDYPLKNTAPQIKIKLESVEETETATNFPVCSPCSLQDILSPETDIIKDSDINTDFVKEEENKFIAEINAGNLLDFIKDEIKSESTDRISSFSVDEFGAHIKYQSIDEKVELQTGTVLSTNSDTSECSRIVPEFNHKDSVTVKQSAECKNNVCLVCSKSCQKPSELKMHMRTHSGERPFACSICGNAYSCKSTLNKHMEYHRECLFPCSVCGKTFVRKSDLKRHTRVHNGERPFACSTCGKAFTQKGSLTKHVTRVHSGEGPFVCSECGISFSDKNNLKTHNKENHTTASERPYRCSVCSKMFVLIDDLVRHTTRIHSGERPFVCSTCGNAFTKNRNLNRHMIIHSGERPFACSICGKAFLVKEHLKRHMRIHSGERPFACSVCGKTFSEKSTATNHEKANNCRINQTSSEYTCSACNEQFPSNAFLKRHLKYCVLNNL